MSDDQTDAAETAQNQGGRIGAQAAGGIDARPGDPTSPQAARDRAAAGDVAQRAAGYGDDKGGDIDRPESPQPR